MAYKAGDRVYVWGTDSFPGKQPAKIVDFVGNVYHHGHRKDYYNIIVDAYGSYGWYDDGDMGLISDSPTSSSMTIMEKIRLAAKGEPEKSFIKTGITNLDGSLTFEGKEAFTEYLLSKNKDDFNTAVVQPLLAEQEKEAE